MFLQYHLLMKEAITSAQKLFEGHSEIIWTQIICSNFINLTLNTKQQLAQYIHMLYTAATGNFRIASRNHSLGSLQYHSWTAASSVSLPHLKFHTQLNKLLGADAFSPQTASNWLWISYSVMSFAQRTTWSISFSFSSSPSSASGTTNSLFESYGLLNYFLPYNLTTDIFCPLIYYYSL